MHETIANPQPKQIPERWSDEVVCEIYHKPFNDLLHQAHQIHRTNHDPNSVQLSTLLNIKSGGCPEDCAYCPQSVRYNTGVEPSKLLDAATVRDAAVQAKDRGATRFCMGAAWRRLQDRDVRRVIELIAVVKSLGMESCLTLGMLTQGQAERLKAAGLDYYNHNIDSSREFYRSIVSTRDYNDRLETLRYVRAAGISVCCGGIVGMGESRDDRVELLRTLANFPVPPESVPINCLVRAEGTPLENTAELDPLEVVRTVACARIIMSSARIRLSAGRNKMSDEMQAMCFYAGVNSIFYGEKLLTTENPQFTKDQELLQRLGIFAETRS